MYYLSIKWYAPGAEFDRPARENLSRRDPPRWGARPDMPLIKGFWNECFFNMVLIRINVSSLGMLLTTELMSSSLICIRRQFSSSDGSLQVSLLVTHGCSYEAISVLGILLLDFKWCSRNYSKNNMERSRFVVIVT